MNKKIIQKIIDELKSESFRKDYVLGILETLLDSVSDTVSNPATVLPSKPTTMTPTIKRDLSEAEILDIEAKARIKNITDIAHD